MELYFFKYHGAGNDFILLDNREQRIALTQDQIAFLCHRHFGIGADGLMLLENAEGYDFKMVYYNSDGRASSMCGNGGRCITAFAQKLGIIESKTSFIAVDGAHEALINENGTVSLHMQDVNEITYNDNTALLDTGSPHFIEWTDDVDEKDVSRAGRAIRKRDEYRPDGVNVNFVQRLAHGLKVRTYERGVEAETLSCGTGVTASAIASVGTQKGNFTVPVYTPGGELKVSFVKSTADAATDVVLTGPAKYVFEGQIKL